MKQILIYTYVVALVAWLAACGVGIPVPTVSSTATTMPSLMFLLSSMTPSPIPTVTPSQTNMPTLTPEPGTSPGCQIINKAGKLFVISYREFYAIGTGTKKLDQSLRDNFPEWAAYKQHVPWSTDPVTLGEIVNNASTNVTSYGVNSSVALVTLGEVHHWQIPVGEDLYLETQEISKQLFYLGWDWVKPGNEEIQDRYPQALNEGSYALYAFLITMKLNSNHGVKRTSCSLAFLP
jgi:hypothetical protein